MLGSEYAWWLNGWADDRIFNSDGALFMDTPLVSWAQTTDGSLYLNPSLSASIAYDNAEDVMFLDPDASPGGFLMPTDTVYRILSRR